LGAMHPCLNPSGIIRDCSLRRQVRFAESAGVTFEPTRRNWRHLRFLPLHVPISLVVVGQQTTLKQS
jgi:hypothetical protein